MGFGQKTDLELEGVGHVCCKHSSFLGAVLE
jgi:hypothetical protein